MALSKINKKRGNLKLNKYYEKKERLAKTNVLKIEERYADMTHTNLNKYIDENVSDEKIQNVKDILENINFMLEKIKLVKNKISDTINFLKKKFKDVDNDDVYKINSEFLGFMKNQERILTIYDILKETKELYAEVINENDFTNKKFTVNMCMNIAKSSELFREIGLLLRECKNFGKDYGMIIRNCESKYYKILKIFDKHVYKQSCIIEDIISEYEKYIISFYNFIGIEIQEDLIETSNPKDINNAILYIKEFVYNCIM